MFHSIVGTRTWHQSPTLMLILYSYVDPLSEILSVMSGLVAARPQLPSHQIPNAGLIWTRKPFLAI